MKEKVLEGLIDRVHEEQKEEAHVKHNNRLILIDVNVAFQKSAHKVLLDDDNLLPLLHLTVEYHGKDPKDAAQNRDSSLREPSPREAPTSGWSALGLSYKVQWPLHILFTPAVLE
eukprot:g44625.t1